jgi:hypothetical protein
MLLAVLVALAGNSPLGFVNKIFHGHVSREPTIAASGSDIFQPIVE